MQPRQNGKNLFEDIYRDSDCFGCSENQRTTHPNEYTYVTGYGFAPPPPHVNERHLIRSYSSALGVSVLCFLLLSPALYTLVYQFLLRLPGVAAEGGPGFQTAVVEELATGVSYALALTIPFYFYCRYVRIPGQRALPLQAPNWSLAIPAIPICLGVSVVGAFATGLIAVVFGAFGLLPVAPDLSAPYGMVAIGLYFIRSAILPALLEEMAFRGVLMQSLRRFGDAFALLTSAAVFALVHGNLVQAPNAFLMGLVMGYFVLRTGSLWTGILIHFVNNAVAVGVSIFARGMDPVAQMGLSYAVYALYIVVGLICLMGVLKNHNDLFVLKSADTVTSEGGKYFFFFTSIGMMAAVGVLVVIASRYFIVI